MMFDGADVDGIASFLIPFTQGKIQYGSLSLVFIVIFIFIMTILLSNLLIGLAVDDIDNIQKEAQIKREAMAIGNYCDLEQKMPKFISKRVMEMEYTAFSAGANTSNFLRNLR